MLTDQDEQFFVEHPDRKARIRAPAPTAYKDQQRAVRYLSECEMEFRSLGAHDKSRRRIIVWRVPRDNPYFDSAKQPLLKIPFLAFADEMIEDCDDVLLPIVDKIMVDALKRMA